MSITKEEVVADLNEAAERMGLDLSDIQEMIIDTIEDALGKAKKLVDLVASKDLKEIKMIAHDIKGACLNFGLKQPAEIVKKMEDTPEDEENASLATELVSILDHLNKLGLGS